MPQNLVEVACTYCQEKEFKVIATGRDFEFNTSDSIWQFVSCNNCGLLRLNPRPKISELDAIYPQEYNCYHIDSFYQPLLNKLRLFFQKRIVKEIADLSVINGLVLDVGCGSGELLLLMKKHGLGDRVLIGSDITDVSKPILEEHGIQFVKGRFEEIEAHEGALDVITMQGVIEHLDNPDAVIKKAYKMLKPEGHFVIITPSSRSWDAKLFQAKYWSQWHFPRHWFIYNPDLIRKHLVKHGFTNVSIKPILSPWSWIQSFHNYFSDRNKTGLMTRFFSMRNPFLILFFSFLNLIQIVITGNTSNMKVIAKK